MLTRNLLQLQHWLRMQRTLCLSAVSLVFSAILSYPLSDSVVLSENVLEILAF